MFNITYKSLNFSSFLLYKSASSNTLEPSIETAGNYIFFLYLINNVALIIILITCVHLSNELPFSLKMGLDFFRDRYLLLQKYSLK